MINRSKVITGFQDLVGFKSPADPDYQLLDEDNKQSVSGYSINDNPLVKISYLYDTQEYASIDTPAFNEFLRDLKKRAIVDVLHRVFNKPDFIDRQVLYKYANNKVELESLPDNAFVGYKITQTTANNYAFEITRALLEFQGTGDVELLLFNTAKKEPVESKVITISSESQEEELNWRIDNTGDYFKGEFYLGYLTNGLPVIPYRREYEFSEVKSDIRGLQILEKEVPDHNEKTLFDLHKEESSELSFGLNFDISSFLDYTDMAIQNKMLFARAIQLQAQINALNEYVTTPRANRNSRLTQEMINYVTVELEGRNVEGITKVGLKDKLKGEVNHIQSEIEKLKSNYTNKGLRTITAG